jgi:hypothetical protein
VRLSLFLKIISGVLVFSLIFLIINEKARSRLFPYFSTRCLEYKQKDFSRKLNDRLVDYSAEAKRKGIKVCKDDRDLRNRLSEGKLVKIKSGKLYVVETMTYSSPCITKDSKVLLDEIARRFRDKVSQKGLKGARIIVTSMTRKTENMKSLRRNNTNSSANSPHMYGNAIDITYKRFIVRKWLLTNCDRKYLKDALGEVIWQLRQEKRCYATYERMQNCFHVVAR